MEPLGRRHLPTYRTIEALIDAVIGRVLDALFAFPVVLMAIAVIAVLGSGERSAMIAIGLIAMPEFARVARSAIIAEKEKDYVLASQAVGASWSRIVFRSILPNTVGPIMVLISLGFAFAILNETALSFLGLGAQPPTPSWGADLATGRRYLIAAPWYSFFPGLAILFLVLALNLTGDGMRDLLDPRRR
ncbi:MAG: ABC transporter permease [Chloroflexota bacterium]|nr:ABC transporter permease [Chloroflexota bacterium]